MSIFIDYPSWFVLLCILAGLIYAAALYTRDRSNRHFSKYLIALLGLLRFAVVAVLCFFLLRPLIKSVDRIIEKPIVVIAQDNSSSIMLGGDTAFYKGGYLQELDQLTAKLAEDYTVRRYSFGDQVAEENSDLRFSEGASDFSTLTEALYSAFSNRNLGAVVIASDGLYNRGNNPVYDLNQLKAPVYTVAMGDTTPRRDALIAEVRNNRLTYLGNRFPVEITVEGRMLEGESSLLSVSRGGEVLWQEDVSFTSNNDQHSYTVLLDAEEAGLQRYTVRIAGLQNEITLSNNTKEVFVDVLDSRQKLLILAAHPHPDVAALRSALSSNENYEVQAEMAADFDGDMSEYSLCIFHQLPDGSPRALSLINSAISNKVPALFVVGKHTNRDQFNQLTTGIQLEAYRGGLTPLQPSYRDGFTLFTLSDKLKAVLKQLPPLSSPTADVSFSPGIQTLLAQKVGLIETDKPLFGFFQGPEVKIGVITGEGIWRWRLVSYLEEQDHAVFNELMTKSVQYLASKQDKSRFRVSGPEDVLATERLIFEAEVYNESYEAVNDAEVRLQVINEDGDDFPYTFSPSGKGYRLDAGNLPVGSYSWVARVTRDGKEFKETGEFVIRPLELEQVRTIADHNLMFQLARRNGGEMFYPDQLDALYSAISSNDSLTASSYEQKQLSDLINYKWILALLILLLSVEWLLRKRNGTY